MLRSLMIVWLMTTIVISRASCRFNDVNGSKDAYPRASASGNYRPFPGRLRPPANARGESLGASRSGRHPADVGRGAVARGDQNVSGDRSFIERATFARKLEDAGFDRALIKDALAIDKTEVSKLISVARAIPDKIIAAVGPAPKVGRPRWLKLADAIADPSARKAALALVGDPATLPCGSDAKFALLFKAATANLAISAKKTWKSADGRASATISKSANRFRSSSRKTMQDLRNSSWNLEILHTEFCSRRQSGDVP